MRFIKSTFGPKSSHFGSTTPPLILQKLFLAMGLPVVDLRAVERVTLLRFLFCMHPY